MYKQTKELSTYLLTKIDHLPLHRVCLTLCKHSSIVVSLPGDIPRISGECSIALLIRRAISLPDAATGSTSRPLLEGEMAVPVSPKLWTSIYCCFFTNSSFILPLPAANSSNLLSHIVKAFSPLFMKLLCRVLAPFYFYCCNLGIRWFLHS